MGHFAGAGGSRAFELPWFDVNYGVGRRLQLKVEFPWTHANDNGEAGHWYHGPGNLAAGVKWRFFGQEGRPLAWSCYPQVEWSLTRQSVEHDVAERGPLLFLPTELTLELGHVEINGEFGRVFGPGGGRSAGGLSTEASPIPHIEFLAEIHAQSVPVGPAELIFNFGARVKLTPQVSLLLAAGRVLKTPAGQPAEVLLLLGLQLNLPGTFQFEVPRTRR